MFSLSTEVDRLRKENQEINLRNTKLLDENLYYSKQLLESRDLLEELQAARAQVESHPPQDQSSNELILDSSTQYGDSPFKLEGLIEIDHRTPYSKGEMSKSKVNIELYRSMNTPVLEEDAKDRAIAEYLDIIQKQSEMIEQLKNMKAPTLIHTRKGSVATAGFIDLHESVDSHLERDNYQFGRKYPKSRLESFHTSHAPESKQQAPLLKKFPQFNLSNISGMALNGSAVPNDHQMNLDRQLEPTRDLHKSAFRRMDDVDHPESPSLGKSVKFVEPIQPFLRSDTINSKNEGSELAESDSRVNGQLGDDHTEHDNHPQDADDSFAVDNPNDEVRSSQGDMMAAQRKQLLDTSSDRDIDNQRYTRAATIHGSRLMVIPDFDKVKVPNTDIKKEGFQKVQSHKSLRPKFEDKSRIQGLMKRFSKLKKSGALSADFSRDYLGILARPRMRELLQTIGDNSLKVYSDVVGLYKSNKKKILTILVATSSPVHDSRRKLVAATPRSCREGVCSDTDSQHH